MRKRRVGVTATSRLIVGNQATGTPQIASEMAAPQVSKTPMGTVATATIECGWKRGDTTGGKDNRAKSSSDETNGYQREGGKWQGGQRAEARMRRCLNTPPGGQPPETPGPLSLGAQFPERKESVKGPQAAHKTRAFDRFLPFRRIFWDEGKGAIGKAGGIRRKPGGSALRAHEALPHTPLGAGPLRPPAVFA